MNWKYPDAQMTWLRTFFSLLLKMTDLVIIPRYAMMLMLVITRPMKVTASPLNLMSFMTGQLVNQI